MSIVPKQVAIDFDGTLQYHEHPYLGSPVPGAIEIVKKLHAAGHTLILLTMRDDDDLEEAKAWLRDHDLKFDYINCNPTRETGSRKVYAHYYIDDHNAGAPLIHDHKIHRKPFVDWGAIENFFKDQGLL